LLLANDTDVDGDTLMMASVQGAVGGIGVVGGNVVFDSQLQRPG
jgi:hypothetical protein